MLKGFIDKCISIENNFFRSTKPMRKLKVDSEIVSHTFNFSYKEINELVETELNRLFVQAMKLKGETQ